MNKDITILEDYKTRKIESIPVNNDNTILVWSCTNCGCETWYIQLSPRDPETGRREFYLECSKCKNESRDILNYI